MTSGFVPRHRIDALVDGVMAITMTLLVLELRLPELGDGAFWNAIIGIEAKFISWIVSFLILALFWIGQARAFRRVDEVDAPLFWLVIFWLLLSSLIPFSSALIGEHNQFSGSHIIYAANLLGVMALATWRNVYIERHEELSGEAAREQVDAGWLNLVMLGICAGMSIALSFYAAPYASIPYALMFPFSLGIVRRPRKG